MSHGPLTRRRLGGLLLLLAAGQIGCGGGGATTAGPDGPTAEAALHDLGELLKTIAQDKKKEPTRQAELDAYEPLAVPAVKAISSKQVVYLWGAGYKPGSAAVVAYEAKAETDGGQVLLQDGTVKRMTADEFKAAPKAGAKK